LSNSSFRKKQRREEQEQEKEQQYQEEEYCTTQIDECGKRATRHWLLSWPGRSKKKKGKDEGWARAKRTCPPCRPCSSRGQCRSSSLLPLPPPLPPPPPQLPPLSPLLPPPRANLQDSPSSLPSALPPSWPHPLAPPVLPRLLLLQALLPRPRH